MNKIGLGIRKSEHLRTSWAVLRSHTPFTVGDSERSIVLCLSGVPRYPHETLPFFSPASQADWDHSPLLMAMWTSLSSRPPSQWALWPPIKASLDSNLKGLRISSAYTALSGHPAYPGALLWKLTHLILLETELWLIKLDVLLGDKELRIMVSNDFHSLSTHCLPLSWAEAASLAICCEAVLTTRHKTGLPWFLGLQWMKEFQASKVKLKNLAKLNEMSSKINCLCTKWKQILLWHH